jgi:hypothetical protein
MNATAAVRGLYRIPRAGPSFRGIETGEEAASRCGWGARVESVRNILSQDGRTITQLSAATRRRYGSRSPYFIPATFFYQLRTGVTPHVCQIAALSESTGYRFADWLRMFGFDLQQIPRLQMRLHPERTVLVTPMEDGFDPFQRPPSLDYQGFWSSFAGSPQAERSRRGRFLFVKIGSGDAMACPELVPGRVARVDRYYAQRVRGINHASMGRLLWLVEQPSGLTCCRLQWIDDRQIVLLPSRPPWGCWPLRLPTEARILGLVDMDFVPQEQVSLPARAEPSDFAALPPPRYREERMRFSDLLRISRRRAGLTFRAAHRLTRSVAQILGNREHAIALGMLSDYEALGRLPRHMAKILSLCAVYCMDFRELMAAAGVDIDDSAKLLLPTPDGRLHFRSEFPSAAADSEGGIVTGYAPSAGARPWKITQS